MLDKLLQLKQSSHASLQPVDVAPAPAPNNAKFFTVACELKLVDVALVLLPRDATPSALRLPAIEWLTRFSARSGCHGQSC